MAFSTLFLLYQEISASNSEIAILFVAVFFETAAFVGIFFSIFHLFLPFFQDLDDIEREPLFLEFQYAGTALISPYSSRILICFLDRIALRVNIYNVFYIILISVRLVIVGYIRNHSCRGLGSSLLVFYI